MSYKTKAEAKAAGQHSRRHQTSKEQEEAKVRYHRISGKGARRSKAFLGWVTRWFHA